MIFATYNDILHFWPSILKPWPSGNVSERKGRIGRGSCGLQAAKTLYKRRAKLAAKSWSASGAAARGIKGACAWDFVCGCYGGWASPAWSSAGMLLVSVARASSRRRLPVRRSATSIVVEGNRRVESRDHPLLFQAGPGERLDAAKIDAGLKALYATGLFQDVRIRPVRRARSSSRWSKTRSSTGSPSRATSKAKDEQLSAEIQSKPRGTLSRPIVQADVQRIIEIYRRSGRYDVRVEPKIIELPNNRVDLVFEINEGGKTGVKTIDFVGNNAYSACRLKDVIKTGETNWLSFLKSNDIYDPDRVEADRDLLRRFYLKNGYADVRIVSAVGRVRSRARRASSSPSRSRKATQYRSARSTSNRTSATSIRRRCARSCALQPGGVYNAEAVEKTVEDMTIEVAKRGYPFADGASARRPRLSRPDGQRRRSSSRRARAPTSSASISAAIPARATTSSGASSISPRATPTTAR